MTCYATPMTLAHPRIVPRRVRDISASLTARWQNPTVVTEHSTAHVSFTVRQERSYMRAECSCGWQSERVSSAGLAGALWDEHRATCDEPSHRP